MMRVFDRAEIRNRSSAGIDTRRYISASTLRSKRVR